MRHAVRRIRRRPVGRRCSTMGMLVITSSLSWLGGCVSPRIVTVTFPDRDANTEQWVCDRKAQNCHGKGPDDVRFEDYEPGMAILSPPKECAHGAARLEIVVERKEVVQVGYTCAQPSAPTGPGDGVGDTVGEDDVP